MPKCLVTHYTDPRSGDLMYLCRVGLTPTKISLHSERCWRHNCPGLRQIKLPTIPKCNYANCDKPIRPTPRAKYCSLKCKSKESSRLYRMKKKNESL